MTETTNQSNGMATGGLVLGIIAIVFSILLFFLPILAIVLGIVGLILSALGLKKAKQLNGAKKGAALTGLILSIIAIVIGIGVYVTAVSVAASMGDEFKKQIENADFDQIMQDAQNNAH